MIQFKTHSIQQIIETVVEGNLTTSLKKEYILERDLPPSRMGME